jgi:hypothetical protein
MRRAYGRSREFVREHKTELGAAGAYVGLLSGAVYLGNKKQKRERAELINEIVERVNKGQLPPPQSLQQLPPSQYLSKNPRKSPSKRRTRKSPSRRT